MAKRFYTTKGADRKIVAYIRVSTDDQATNGVSLDAQEARIAAYGVASAFEVSEVISHPRCRL